MFSNLGYPYASLPVFRGSPNFGILGYTEDILNLGYPWIILSCISVLYSWMAKYCTVGTGTEVHYDLHLGDSDDASIRHGTVFLQYVRYVTTVRPPALDTVLVQYDEYDDGSSSAPPISTCIFYSRKIGTICIKMRKGKGMDFYKNAVLVLVRIQYCTVLCSIYLQMLYPYSYEYLPYVVAGVTLHNAVPYSAVR